MKLYIQHAMEALYPPTPDFPGVEDTGVPEFLDRFRRESTPLMWLGLVLGSFVFIWSPILTLYLPLPSFLLSAKQLDRHAHRVTYSRFYLVRQAVFLVKLAAGLCWGRDPRVRQRVGLAPYPEDPGTWRTS